MAAHRYRADSVKTDIHFALGECSLGAVLVAKTAQGVCAVFLDDTAAALVRQLEEQFPRAHLWRADAALTTEMASTVRLIDRPTMPFKSPLDVQGSAFQRRVWHALQSIPAGQTISYSALAALIGQPKAARAVASACAANTVAVAIPCHRVVHASGALSGYRWGVERKRALLARELAMTVLAP